MRLSYNKPRQIRDSGKATVGDFLRDTVKSDVRNAIWNSAKQSSFTPIANWFKNVDDMGVIAHLGYFYGFWHIWRDVKGYLG